MGELGKSREIKLSRGKILGKLGTDALVVHAVFYQIRLSPAANTRDSPRGGAISPT